MQWTFIPESYAYATHHRTSAWTGTGSTTMSGPCLRRSLSGTEVSVSTALTSMLGWTIISRATDAVPGLLARRTTYV